MYGTIGHRHMSNNRFADIGLPNPDGCDPILWDAGRIDQTVADAKRANGRGQVAAITAPVDKGLVDRHLSKKIVNVVIGARAF